MSATPPERIGPFDVLGLLGSGGMGTVYRAVDTRLGRTVALKLLRPDLAADERARSRLTREAQAASRIDHPNIGTVDEVGEHDGQPYIAMALHEGETLASRLRRGRMPVAEVEAILRQIASGLAAAHRAGIVHRDLKPGNVMLTAGGTVKILDFGLAKVAGRTADSLTSTGAVMGTVAYMSPEQARGEELDARTDVWALGVIAYEMLSGESPFGGPTDPAILSRILTEEPPSVSTRRSGIPPWLAVLVSRMLAKKREDRPRDGAAVVSALAARHAGSRRTVVYAATIAIVLLVATLFALRQQSSPRTTASVVVLPCQVFGNEDARFLTDAVPTTMTTVLAQVDGLEAQFPPTSFQWDPAKGDVTLIARTYRARDCLRCSVTAQGPKLSLDLQLVELRGGKVRWSHHYDGMRDAFLPLVELAANGAREALVPVSAPIKVGESAPSTSEAELQVRLGQYYANVFNITFGNEAFDRSTAAYAKALEIDPSTPAAAVGLAWLHAMRIEVLTSVQRDAMFEETTFPWTERAIAMDPGCAEAWPIKAYLARLRGAGMRETFALALRGAGVVGSPCRGSGPPPAHGLNLMFDHLSYELQSAAEEEAVRQDPLRLHSYLHVSDEYRRIGRLEESWKFLETARSIDASSPAIDESESAYFVDTRQAEKARRCRMRVCNRQMEHRLASDSAVVSVEESAYELLIAIDEGDIAVVTRSLARLEEELEGPAPSGLTGTFVAGFDPYDFACRGMPDLAVRIAVMKDAAGYVEAYDMYTLNPAMAPLRTDPRLVPIIARAKARYDEMIDILLDARAHGELPSYLDEAFDRILVREGRSPGTATAR
ncbi:MAG: protein kinase [Acidobacteriota bacterium]